MQKELGGDYEVITEALNGRTTDVLPTTNSAAPEFQKPATSASSGLTTRWVLAAELHHRLVEWQFFAQRFGPLHSAKAATENDDAFRAHPWRGKQLTSIGNSITIGELPAAAFDAGTA
jgi:hypothetical protein